MSWADEHITALGKGETVSFRPVGNSMKGLIESGDLVTVKPFDHTEMTETINIGDIVLCRVGKNVYVHLVKDTRLISTRDFYKDQYLIGNNKGGINGWISRGAIYGVVTKVEK